MRKVLEITGMLLVALILFSGCGYKYYLKTGKEDFNNLKYADAKDKFNTSIEKEPESYEALKMLALTLQKMKDYKGAEQAYQLALNFPQATLEDRFNYGSMLMSSDKHANAELVFREYLTARPGDKVAKSLLESCQFIELFKEDSGKYNIEALPLLSNLSMYSPLLIKEGLAYTAERAEEGNKANPWTGNSYNDVFYVELGGADQKPVAPIFNSVYNDGPIAFNESQDYAVLTRSYSVNDGRKRKANELNENNLFLYSTELIDGVWTPLKELSMNSEDYSTMHPALSAKGDTLYFSSDRVGGEGKYDLYMSTRGNEGNWTKPKNLGSEVNTAANEVFPVLKSDGSLYFSSNGHPSLGGLDIFKTENMDGSWRKPRNMNYPVNSTNDDLGLVYEDNDNIGYFSSNRNGVDRIYKLVSRATGVVAIDGTVLDKDQSPMQGATVKLIDTRSGEVIQELVTGPDGKFDFVLEPDKNYRIESNRDGYFTESYERSTVGQSKDEKEEVVFNMRELLVTDPDGTFDPTGDNVYKVENIYYDYNKSHIRNDAALELNKLVKLMRDNPGISIELHSHTDAQGEDEYNLGLSQRRVESVRKYIVQKGLDFARVSGKGYGESRIINQCKNGVTCTDEQHEENRRTEFIVTELKK